MRIIKCNCSSCMNAKYTAKGIDQKRHHTLDIACQVRVTWLLYSVCEICKVRHQKPLLYMSPVLKAPMALK